MEQLKNKEKLANIVEKLQPASVKEMLMPRLRQLKSMRRKPDGEIFGEYNRFRNLILKELVDEGLVIMPDLKLPPEYQRFRHDKGGIFPDEEYGHLETAYRDAWKRFLEVRINAKPSQVVWISEENNIWPNYRRMELSKRHHLVTTPRHSSIDEVTTLAADAMAAKLREMRVGDIRVGIDRQGLGYDKKGYEVTHLSDIFRGILMDERLPLRIGGDFIGDVELYADNMKDVWMMGAEAIVGKIPSLSRPGMVHYATLHHIPVVDPDRLKKGRIEATKGALVMSYNFKGRDNCEKPLLWTVKYGRDTIRIFGRTERKGDESWGDDMHVVFAYLRVMRFANWQRAGQIDPGRNFVVLPMFPEPTSETKKGFRKMYGLKTTTGTEGGVIIEGRYGENITHFYNLSSKLVDFDIALHNLVAFTKDPMTTRGPRIEYSRISTA